MPKKQRTPSSKPTEPTRDPAAQLLQREPDFISKYANNVRFHNTVHDLTLVFGQSDVTTGSEVIKQHTGITLPWSVVKIALYYLKVNLAIHEAYNGVVPIPSLQIPQPLPAPSKELIANDRNAQKSYEAATKIRDEFIANL